MQKTGILQLKDERHQSIKTDLEVTEVLELAGKNTKTAFTSICHLFVSRDMYDKKEGPKSNFERW